MGAIYKITNTINNKCYIGQTTKDIYKRFNQHKSNFKLKCSDGSILNTKNKLYKAFYDFGVDCFTVSLIKSDIKEDELDYYEKQYIEKYDTVNNGYNVYRGGVKYHLTQKDRHKISNAIRHKLSTDVNYRNKIVQNMKLLGYNSKGRKVSEKTRLKLSTIASKRTGNKNGFFGRCHTEETKNRIRKRKDTNIIYMYDIDDNLLNVFDTMHEAVLYMQNIIGKNIKPKSIQHGISVCLCGIQKKSMGYKWRGVKRSNDYLVKE